MKQTIELHKKWKADPSKGEVFTPTELVHEMLDKIPTNVWENPESKFLDPCMGKGTFIIEIVSRLINIYGYSKENALSRVYGYDICLKYVNYLKRGMLINVFHTKDFLNEKIEMKFDVVIGNPPYQDSGKPGDNALYQYFTQKVLSGLLKDNGYFSFVVPTTMTDYLLNCEKNRTFVKDFYKIKSFVFDSPEKYFRQQGIGTTAFFFVIENEIVNEDSQIVEITYLKDNVMVSENIEVFRGKVLPKKNFQNSKKLTETFLSENSFEFKTMVNKRGVRRRIRNKQIQDGTITLEPNGNNIYPIIDKITKTNGLSTYFHSEIMNDFEKPKVIFSNSGYPLAQYINYPVNLSDNITYFVPKNEIEGQNLVKVINSDIFSQVIDLYSTNARDAHKTIKRLKKVDLTNVIIENETDIKVLFGLS
jgi:16S rRNA G966 N2-methylase RsmD